MLISAVKSDTMTQDVINDPKQESNKRGKSTTPKVKPKSTPPPHNSLKLSRSLSKESHKRVQAQNSLSSSSPTSSNSSSSSSLLAILASASANLAATNNVATLSTSPPSANSSLRISTQSQSTAVNRTHSLRLPKSSNSLLNSRVLNESKQVTFC